MPAISNASLGDGFMQGFNFVDQTIRNHQNDTLRRQAIDDQRQQTAIQNARLDRQEERQIQAINTADDRYAAEQQYRQGRDAEQDRRWSLENTRANRSMAIQEQNARTKQLLDEFEVRKMKGAELKERLTQAVTIAMNGGAPFSLAMHEEAVKGGMPALSPYSYLDPGFINAQLRMGESVGKALQSGDLSKVNSPETLDAINQAYADQIGKGVGDYSQEHGGTIIAKRISKLLAGPRGSVVAHVTVHLDNGKSYEAPLTMARSSDKHDPVRAGDTGAMLDDVMGRYPLHHWPDHRARRPAVSSHRRRPRQRSGRGGGAMRLSEVVQSEQAPAVDAAPRMKLSDVMASAAPEPERAGVMDTVAGIGRDAVRGAGLAARSVIEGAGSIPIAITDAAGRMVMGDDYQPVSETLSRAGLPEPETVGEQLGSAIGRGGSGALVGVGAGHLLQGASGATARGVGDLLAAAPGSQVAAGASGGASGELARQAGIGPDGQLVASVVGGIGGGIAARGLDAPAAYGHLPAGARQNAPLNETPALPAGGRTVGGSLPPGAATTAEGAAALRHIGDQADTLARDGAAKIGLSWDTLDDALKTRMQEVAADAAKVNSDLPPEAVARAAVYESLGIKPTRALITRDFADALGFPNRVKAVTAYKGSYSKDWIVGPVTEMTIDQFKEWLEGDTTKPMNYAAESIGVFHRLLAELEGKRHLSLADRLRQRQKILARKAELERKIAMKQDQGVWANR